MRIDSMMHARSIAILGVSQEKQKVGYLVAKNLVDQGYKGDIFFVNPKGGTLLGKKVYENIDAVGKPIELAVLAVPGHIALPYLDDLKRLNIHNAVVFAAGFKETGPEGAAMEAELSRKAREYGISLLGPNCIGFISTKDKINVTFLKHVCPPGNIGFLSQSGAIGSVMLDYFAAHKNLGFSYFISLGNKAVCDESDAMQFLLESDDTKVIGMYVEDVHDGNAFREVLSKARGVKPVVVLKSGSTKEGSQAALSHTGGLVGDDQVFDAVLRQYGAIRAETFTEFMTILRMFSFGRVPLSRSVLVLSNAGGVGVLLSDLLVHAGMKLTTITEQTVQAIQKAFGPSKKVSVHNPIDVLGDASAFDYKQAIDETMQEKDIGSVIILLTPQANTQIPETARIVTETQAHFAGPVYPVFMGEESLVDSYRHFEEERIAGFPSYDYLPSALAKIVRSTESRAKKRPKTGQETLSRLSLLASEREIGDIITGSKSKKMLNLQDSIKVLEYAGIPVAPMHMVSTARELKQVGASMGYPVVAKISSDSITHKTEVKGVIPSIKSYEELEQAFSVLSKIDPDTKSAHVLVQKMVSGFEIFMGAKRDPTFGIVLVLGMGGVYTELIKDVSFRVYPFTEQDFSEMVAETKVQRLLDGFRGSKPINPKPIYASLMHLGGLMKKFSVIKEIDVNPCIVSSTDFRAVDCRIIF